MVVVDPRCHRGHRRRRRRRGRHPLDARGDEGGGQVRSAMTIIARWCTTGTKNALQTKLCWALCVLQVVVVFPSLPSRSPQRRVSAGILSAVTAGGPWLVRVRPLRSEGSLSTKPQTLAHGSLRNRMLTTMCKSCATLISKNPMDANPKHTEACETVRSPWPPVAARGRQKPPVGPWPPVAAQGCPWPPVAACGGAIKQL